MKKGLSLLLAILLALTGLAAAEEEPARDLEHLTIGNTTPITGLFFSSLWGAGTSDIDVRSLIHGYNLVQWYSSEGMFNMDPTVVTGLAVTENAEGDRTFTIALAEDMVYSDGSPITASDYAFSILLQISPFINRMGGVHDRKSYLVGYEDYLDKNAPLLYTEFTSGDFGLTVERVLKFRGPDKQLADFVGQIDVLYRNAEGELSTEKAGMPIHVNQQGVITDWRYENGVRVFADGTSNGLAGVRMLSDYMLSITISHEYLPFFYELGLLSCDPYPISVIAPGVEVRDDGSGVYLANKDGQAEPVFTEALLEKTILDPETGYLYHPAVCSGPYKLVSFDGVTAELEINPLYKGDADGARPSIPRLTYTLAHNETMVEKLATGELDVINKVTRADTITAAINLVRTGEYGQDQQTDEQFLMANYPRTGLSFVSFRCERPTVGDVAVRRAMAWCMDRDQIVHDYTGGFGIRVDSYYGFGQWLVGLVEGTAPIPLDPPEDENDAEANAAYEAQLAEWEGLSLEGLEDYEVDLERARFWLTWGRWEQNSDGIWEKNGEKLDLTLAYPEGNIIAQSFEKNWIPYLEEVGIKLTLKPLPMNELLALYNRQSSAHDDVDMIYLAYNFDLIYDPSVHFIVENGGHNWSYTRYNDEELYNLAVDMRKTEPGDLLGYVKKWVAFEEYFNETLPMIPLYSNVYFDFYTALLQEYHVGELATMGQTMVKAELKEDALEEEIGSEGNDDIDDFMEFDD